MAKEFERKTALVGNSPVTLAWHPLDCALTKGRARS